MPFDYKKVYQEFYLPPKQPGIIEVPPMNFLAVRGRGDPNEPDGAYKAAVGLLYGIAFTIKMSNRSDQKMEGYFSYVVPPLEGLWKQKGTHGIDYARKKDFEWISMIRLPEFVTEDDFRWSIAEATRKKRTDFSAVEFFSYQEGLCVQCMHIGPFDEEPATIEKMERFLMKNGYISDLSGTRLHHEIYLSDPRRCAPEKLRTVIRQPVKKSL